MEAKEALTPMEEEVERQMIVEQGGGVYWGIQRGVIGKSPDLVYSAMMRVLLKVR